MKAFSIILTPVPGSPVPVEVRLRTALKQLLRYHGLRAVEVLEVERPDRPAVPGGKPAGKEWAMPMLGEQGNEEKIGDQHRKMAPAMPPNGERKTPAPQGERSDFLVAT